jgi:hypothetical protein
MSRTATHHTPRSLSRQATHHTPRSRATHTDLRCRPGPRISHTPDSVCEGAETCGPQDAPGAPPVPRPRSSSLSGAMATGSASGQVCQSGTQSDSDVGGPTHRPVDGSSSSTARPIEVRGSSGRSDNNSGRIAAVPVARAERPACHCVYAAAWSSVASTYGLPLEQADTDTIARILARC